jgi:hypothetical protein
VPKQSPYPESRVPDVRVAEENVLRVIDLHGGTTSTLADRSVSDVLSGSTATATSDRDSVRD